MEIRIADMVWPALFLAERMAAWWGIGLGLLVELFFVRFLTGFSWLKSALVDIAMNAASSLLGLFLIPITGVVWEFSVGRILWHFHIGTFNPGTWTVTFVFAALINAALEASVLRYAFRQRPFKRLFLWLALANAISVAIAFISLFRNPPQS
jgi:hypothetical protein